MSAFLISSIKFTSGVITPAAAVSPEILTTENHTDFGKGPLCSGASQFAADYAAAQLSIDKRMSCTVSDDALSIFA